MPESVFVDRDDLLGDFRARVEWPAPGPPLPVLVVGGPAGSGKTALLHEARRLTDSIHNAYLRAESAEIGSPLTIMSVLAWQLMKKRRSGIADLEFARFLLGQFAIERSQGTNDRRRAQNEMRELLAELRAGRIPQDITDFAQKSIDVALTAAGQPAPAGTSEALFAFAATLYNRRRVRAEDWWAAKDGDAVDALVDLSAGARSPDADQRAEVERQMMRAFLADLRWDYRPQRGDRLRGGAAQGGVAAVALLDNVDRGAGGGFLELLVAARREPGSAPDPLLVLATSGRPAAGFDFQRPLQVTPSELYPTAYGIRLPDLPETAARKLGARLGHQDPVAVGRAHRVTAGHAGGLATLLTQAGPEPADRVVALSDRLRGGLIAEIPDEYDDRLVTCSALRELTPTTEAAALDVPRVLPIDSVRPVLVEHLWTSPGTDPLVLHPWLRRLLLLGLRDRDPAHPHSWAKVHHRLREHFRTRADDDGVFYHSMALVGREKDLGLPPHASLVSIARELRLDAERKPFGRADARLWLDRLDAMAQAPNALPKGPAVDESALLSDYPDEQTEGIARLVAGEWLRTDPLAGPLAGRQRYSARRYLELATSLHSSCPALADDLYTRGETLAAEGGSR